MVHNLGLVDWSRPDDGFDWARRFDDAAAEAMTSAPERVVTLSEHADYDQAVPTPDHFLPLLYVAGLASAAGDTAHVLVDGYAMGSLSMTAYVVGRHDVTAGNGEGAPALPHVPPDETNV